jgi:glycosyltransferase involved in cell wall biosynthesis
VLYSSITAALLWPRPGAVRFDAPARANRPGRHGIWQRPLERRRLTAAPLLVPWSARALEESPGLPRPRSVVVPVPVEPSGPPEPRDIAAITYGANPDKKGLDRVLATWAGFRRDGEELVVAGVTEAEARERVGAALSATPGVRYAGALARGEYRALVRRARAFLAAPRREDHGIAQLEALADGTPLVSTVSPGPYVALGLARELDPRLVSDDLGDALRVALDDPRPDYADAARAAMAPLRRDAVDRVVSERLLPALLGGQVRTCHIS